MKTSQFKRTLVPLCIRVISCAKIGYYLISKAILWWFTVLPCLLFFWKFLNDLSKKHILLGRDRFVSISIQLSENENHFVYYLILIISQIVCWNTIVLFHSWQIIHWNIKYNCKSFDRFKSRRLQILFVSAYNRAFIIDFRSKLLLSESFLFSQLLKYNTKIICIFHKYHLGDLTIYQIIPQLYW